jgi:hypothetical protein
VRSIAVAVGERSELHLRGRGGGYSWSPELLGRQDVVAVRRVPAAAASRPDAGGLPPDNSSRPESFEIEGRAPGRTRVRMALRRSWEGDREPLELEEFDVLVVPADPLTA